MSDTENKDAERYRTLKLMLGMERDGWTVCLTVQKIHLRVYPEASLDNLVDEYTELYRRLGRL